MKLWNRSILKIFLALVIPIVALWIWLTVDNMQTEKQLIIQSLIEEDAVAGEHKAEMIERHMAEIIENLKVVRDADEMAAYLGNSSLDSKVHLTQLFVRLMNNKTGYDQLRFLDANGYERIRVDNRNGVSVVEDEDLQHKGERYYFKETMALGYDQVYISPLDLNVERGMIEVPHKPMLRFATKVQDASGQTAGMVIINYKAGFFIDLIAEHGSHELMKDASFRVLNATGHFIVHPEPNRRFSFMREGNAARPLQQEEPSLWNRMVQSDFSGHARQGDRLYTYHDLLVAARQSIAGYDMRWIALHTVDTSSLLAPARIARELFLTNNVAIFGIILFISLSLSIIIDRLRSKDIELSITKEIADSTGDSVLITDADTRITFVNQAYEQSTGYAKDEVLGKTPADFKSGKHDAAFYRAMWQAIHIDGRWEGLLWDKKKGGLLYPKKMKILAVRDAKGKRAHHYVGIFSDFSVAARPQDTAPSERNEVGHFVMPDQELMAELLLESVRSDQTNFLIAYIAIDNLPQVQSLLRQTNTDPAKAFSALLTPLVGPDGFIAQTGPNRFVLIATLDAASDMDALLRRLQRKMGQVIKQKGQDVFFKTRMGFAHWPGDATDVRTLIHHAQVALEWTRQQKEADVVRLEPYMLHRLNRDNEIEGQLRKAVERGELSMVYQPQIDIRTGDITGMEALVRWTNPQLGRVSPAEFIPVAERNHLMIEIGDWITDRVLTDLMRMEQHLAHRTLSLRCAINLSALQMEESGFAEKLLRSIDKHGIQGDRLELELTETLLLSDPQRSQRVLQQMRNRGITVAIDDFGTGYSSLSYLNELHVDKIKIDRSFIQGYPDRDDGRLARILVNMSKSLGMSVLAEGVETPEQLAFLQSIGCDSIQGYYYSRPLTLPAFLDYLSGA